jgi:signal transduction histidine kinase
MSAAGTATAHDQEDDAGSHERLDAFAERAAHVLGTGVSVAGGYATLLRRRHGDALGEEGIRAVEALQGGLGRIRLFMEDLLELARTPDLAVAVGSVDAEAVARAAADALDEPLDGAGVELEIGAIPPLRADEALARRLFHHLIRAAAAAAAPGDGGGRVVVSGRHVGDVVRIEVADDGPPVAAGEAAVLFEPFALPRGEGPLAGAGVSLGICRRIAARHGGAIRARPGAAGGCVVEVDLPVAA